MLDSATSHFLVLMSASWKDGSTLQSVNRAYPEGNLSAQFSFVKTLNSKSRERVLASGPNEMGSPQAGGLYGMSASPYA